MNVQNNPRVLACLIGAALAVAASSAVAANKAPKKETAKPAAAAPAQQLSAKDSEFVNKAAMAGMAEVQEGQLATENGASSEVKKFGATMVVDHNKANDKLKTLAQTNGWMLPTDLDGEMKADVDKLRAAKGKDFDSTYIEHEQKDHDTAVALFKDEAQNGDSPALKQFAQETLPTLEHHQKMAHDMKPMPQKR